jgi:hypothetical protein
MDTIVIMFAATRVWASWTGLHEYNGQARGHGEDGRDKTYVLSRLVRVGCIPDLVLLVQVRESTIIQDIVIRFPQMNFLFVSIEKRDNVTFILQPSIQPQEVDEEGSNYYISRKEMIEKYNENLNICPTKMEFGCLSLQKLRDIFIGESSVPTKCHICEAAHHTIEHVFENTC